jgi:hypothetical protein
MRQNALDGDSFMEEAELLPGSTLTHGFSQDITRFLRIWAVVHHNEPVR